MHGYRLTGTPAAARPTAMIVALTLIAAVLTGLASPASAAPAGVVLDSGGLADLAVIPRSPGATAASFTVTGTATNAVSVVATVSTVNQANRTFRSSVAADGTFSLVGWIRVELQDHDVLIEAVDAQWVRTPLASYTRVVAGDVFVVQGQSNAVRNGGSAHSEFARTYGGLGQSVTAEANRRWFVAAPAGVGGAGGFGSHMAAVTVQETGVPMAIFNHANGGKPASFFQRDDADPFNLDTNYGRMLTRLSEARVTDKVRATVYYQGESDQNQPQQHATLVPELIADWNDDFTLMDRTYVIQVREGCIVGSDLAVREAQRNFAQVSSEVTTVSANHIPGFDGCHYDAAGYGQIGDELSELLLRDYYRRADLVGIDSPLPYFARVGDVGNTVELYFANRDDVVSGGAANQFVLSAGGSATTAVASPGKLVLTFSDTVAVGSALSNISDQTGLWLSPAGRSMLAVDGLSVGSAGATVPGLGLDVTRPSRANQMQLTETGPGQATIVWSAANDDVGVDHYDLYRSTGGGGFTVVGSSQGLSVVDDAVAAGETYSYYLRAVDAAGNIGWRNGIRTISLSGGNADTERPSTPTGLRVSVSGSQATLTWNASTDNVGVTGYVIYDADDGAMIRTVGATTATITGLPVGQHRFFVKAIDAAANHSWRTNTGLARIA